MFEFGGTTNQRSALPAELWPRYVARSQKCPFATVLQHDSSMRGGTKWVHTVDQNRKMNF